MLCHVHYVLEFRFVDSKLSDMPHFVWSTGVPGTIVDAVELVPFVSVVCVTRPLPDVKEPLLLIQNGTALLSMDPLTVSVGAYIGFVETGM